MQEIADRYRRVAATFTERAEAVPPAAWEHPAPCDGWVARDVVRHLVGWIPPFLSAGAGVDLSEGPSVDADPVGAWTHLRDALQALLDDPARAATAFEHPQAGQHRLDDAIGAFVLGDVLVHTWDLARAAGLDEHLDPGEVHRMLTAMEPVADVLAASGHYGQRVPVPADADEQTRLIALTGRTP